MNDGFHFLDIIFFAMVAAFLVLRLRSVLGRRTGNERPQEQWRANGGEVPADNVIDLTKARRPVPEPPPSSPAGVGLASIRAADPQFATDVFVGGARAAFEMIVGAYALGDKATLEPLLAPDVYRRFADAIDARRTEGETLETELISVRSTDIVEARMDGANAVITVRFVSEQVNVLRDASGRVLEGDPSRVTDVIDEWTFRRDVRASDPNWMLVATRTPEET